MQSHPSPCAHVCTTLPPGDLPMRGRFPIDQSDRLRYISECGRVRRTYIRVFDDYHGVPLGTWYTYEVRTDNRGEDWIKQPKGEYHVTDDFGFLARVDGKGGAA